MRWSVQLTIYMSNSPSKGKGVSRVGKDVVFAYHHRRLTNTIVSLKKTKTQYHLLFLSRKKNQYHRACMSAWSWRDMRANGVDSGGPRERLIELWADLVATAHPKRLWTCLLLVACLTLFTKCSGCPKKMFCGTSRGSCYPSIYANPQSPRAHPLFASHGPRPTTTHISVSSSTSVDRCLRPTVPSSIATLMPSPLVTLLRPSSVATTDGSAVDHPHMALPLTTPPSWTLSSAPQTRRPWDDPAVDLTHWPPAARSHDGAIFVVPPHRTVTHRRSAATNRHPSIYNLIMDNEYGYTPQPILYDRML